MYDKHLGEPSYNKAHHKIKNIQSLLMIILFHTFNNFYSLFH